MSGSTCLRAYKAVHGKRRRRRERGREIRRNTGKRDKERVKDGV